MRAVVQRVRSAWVEVDGTRVAEIRDGLIAFVGVAAGDDLETAPIMAAKIGNLRVFEDDRGKMSRSLKETGGELLLVPQFTLIGDVRNGNRPDFHRAAGRERALTLLGLLAAEVEAEGVPVAQGVFGAMMRVVSDGIGPVTILIDSERQF
jgi:D-tyrosyl-tRNA(Tyr) deacylase